MTQSCGSDYTLEASDTDEDDLREWEESCTGRVVPVFSDVDTLCSSGLSFSTAPAHSSEDTEKAQCRRRLLAGVAQSVQDICERDAELRIDSADGVLRSRVAFLHKHGRAEGQRLWDIAARARTTVASPQDITPTAQLSHASLGRRVQLAGSGQVLLAVSDGTKPVWKKLTYKEFSAEERAYCERAGQDSKRAVHVLPMKSLTPTKRLQEAHIGARVQIQDTHEVLQVARKEDGTLGWKRVHETEWTAQEVKHASER